MSGDSSSQLRSRHHQSSAQTELHDGVGEDVLPYSFIGVIMADRVGFELRSLSPWLRPASRLHPGGVSVAPDVGATAYHDHCTAETVQECPRWRGCVASLEVSRAATFSPQRTAPSTQGWFK